MPPDKKTCAVCCEIFNKSNNKKCACNYCDYEQCASCVQRYIITTTLDAHCMNCKKGWTNEILHSMLTKTFLNKDYKERREKLLFEREQALLPETQPYAEEQKAVRKVLLKLVPFEKRSKEVASEIYKIERILEAAPINERLTHLRKLTDYQIEKDTIKREIHYVQRETYYIQRPLMLGAGAASSHPKERRVFVRVCPADGCKGFLSQGWKCGMCDIRVCADCHEIKETDTEHTARVQAGGELNHVCKPENVETAKLLARDTKACPKCAIMITKIQGGCDQMFCTQCQTTFSWNTGEIQLGGVLHNPHYYEWLRKQNNGAIPRNLGDVPCGGLPRFHDINTLCSIYTIPETTIQKLRTIHRMNSHIQSIELPRYRTDRIADNRELRIKYLLNEINDEKFKKILQQNEKTTNKKTDIRMVIDMYLGATLDIFRNLAVAASKDAISERILEIEYLRKYFNESMMPISKRYGCVVPVYTEAYTFLSTQY